MRNRCQVYKWLVFSFLVFSFLGFLDATYLTVQYYFDTIPPCGITAGCGAVLTSEYSAIGGIPVALIGSIYYLILFLLAVFTVDTKRKIIRFAAYLTPVGFLASLYFVYLQFFVIKAVCSYCMVSVATSIILFILSLVIIPQLSKAETVLEKCR